jgi:CHAT domain-containing protein
VFFEAPHRTAETLAAMVEAFGPDRPGAVCRELTKTYEEVRRGPLAQLAAWAAQEVRGEVTLVVAGAVAPVVDVEAAAAEVAALARCYPDAVCLRGDAATAGAVSAALDGADLAHVAAHGRFRVDNPLLSCLELADGPLTVYDLEALARAPRCLVLSACDSGLSGVRPGDELMGLAGALFALGTRTLIASVIPVPDATTAELMLALHRHLQAGLPPAASLALAQQELAGRHGAAAAAAAFVCFGAG